MLKKRSGLFWGGYFLFEWASGMNITHNLDGSFIMAALHTGIAFLATWVTLHVIIQRYFLPVRKRGAWIILTASIIFFTLLSRIITVFIVGDSWNGGPKGPFLEVHEILGECIWLYLLVGFTIMLYFMRAWYDQKQLSASLKKDVALAQLELLKSQVHPHFIFNTLNNIYSLSLHADPRTPEQIHRLSSLLSYMLYDSKSPYIPIAKEVEYLNNYIELQKIRYSDRLDISMNIFGSLDQFYITPLLLLPLLENSFKHGVSQEAEHGWIRVDLSRTVDWMVIKIENSVSEQPAGNNEPQGIGLHNVRRRLEILYPEQHEFRILKGDQSFMAILGIKNHTNANNVPHH
jgi:two-component system LytT family sensor kinase